MASRRAVDLGLAALSAILLVLSVPKFDLSHLAWVALAPLLVALDGKSVPRACGLAFVTGIAFFAGLFYWIWAVPAYNVFDEQLIEDVIGGHGPDPVEQSGKERDASNEGQAARARYRLSVECDQQWRQRHPRQVAQVELGNAQDEQYRAERGEAEIDCSTAGHQRQYCLF